MAIFCCTSCGHQAEFSQFNAGSVEVFDEDIQELIEEDITQCPECGSEGAFEL